MTPLRRRLLEDMGIRNLADNTQSAYLQQIIAYSNHFHRPPEELGPEAVRAYQVYLTETRRLSPSSVSVATGALRFGQIHLIGADGFGAEFFRRTVKVI